MKQELKNWQGNIFRRISKRVRFICIAIILCPSVSYATSTGMLTITSSIEAENVSPVSLPNSFDQAFYAYKPLSPSSGFYQGLTTLAYEGNGDQSAADSATDNIVAMNTSLTASNLNIVASSQIEQINTQPGSSVKKNPGLATLSTPASMWLFGAALIGFVTISRRVSF